MDDRTELCERIREAFGSIEFPAHQGLRASRAVDDDWISDPQILSEITAREDFHGEWWEIPDGELFKYRSSLYWLDADGFYFYFPAYLTLAIKDDFTYRTYWWVLSSMNSDDRRFHLRFSKIIGAKKAVCLEFLRLLKQHLESLYPTTDVNRKIERVEQILNQEYWAS